MDHLVGLIQSLIGVEKHCPSLSMTRSVPSANASSISLRVYLTAFLAFGKGSSLRLLGSRRETVGIIIISTEFNFCFDYLLNN